MNNAPPPGWTAPISGIPSPADGQPDVVLGHARSSNDGPSSRSPSQPPRRSRRGDSKDKPGLAKKLAFVTHLLKALDLVVFAELSGLYYMECSAFRFILRAAGQYMYLTPKDESFPFLMPASRIHVLLVAIPNLVCILLHLFGSLPTGPDFHRGYQHGGLIIDFIGQKPPTSRLFYLLADAVILSIQCLMLTVHNQRETLRVSLKTFRPLWPDMTPDRSAARLSEHMDLDAQERGFSGPSQETALDGAGGIQLQSLDDARQGDEASDQTAASDSLLSDTSGAAAEPAQLSDLMDSGNAILGHYRLLHSLVSAATDIESAAAHSLQTIGYGATMAALQARRRGVQARSPMMSQLPGSR